MKNEQEEMTKEEFKQDPYAGYGLTHLDIVDSIANRILKVNLIGGLVAMLGLFLSFQYDYTAITTLFIGIYVGILFLSAYLVRMYGKTDYTKFRKVNITDGKEPEE